MEENSRTKTAGPHRLIRSGQFGDKSAEIRLCPTLIACKIERLFLLRAVLRAQRGQLIRVPYECLIGKLPFPGDTITESIAKIPQCEPDWTLLPTATPAIIRSLLRRCLQKNPTLRLHDIADTRLEIAEARSLASIPETISVQSPSLAG